MKLKNAISCLALAASVLAYSGGALNAAQEKEMLRVYMDHARVLRLDRPVAKVIIGNASVADATVADSRTIVLTGKSFGTTNLLLLDADGNPIVDERILVSIDEGNTVRIYKQTERSVFSCSPNCEEHTQQEKAASSEP